jgi:hypothetical protein
MNLSQSTSSEPLAPHRRTLLPSVLGGTEAPDEQTANAYAVLSADPAVRKLAMRCRRECEALIRQGGYEHFIAATVMGSAMHGCTPTEWLQSELELIRAEAAAIKEERTRASARRQEAKDWIRPLSAAIAERSMRYPAERAVLLERVRLSEGARTSTWKTLREAGLTDAEINAKGVEPTIATVDGWRARIKEIERKLAIFAKWSADPLHDVEILRSVEWLEQYLPAVTSTELEHA